MAKESASTRIPRLDGASRIPLPGSLRHMQNTRPTASSTAIQRPTSLAVLNAPPVLGMNSLKKSSSGDRLNNAMSMMSKKTTTALKKFFSKPDKGSHSLKNPNSRKATEKQTNTPSNSTGNDKNNITPSMPRPLTRSDTFVRSDSSVNLLSMTQDILAQSTPAVSTTKPTARDQTRHILNMTQSLDVTCTPMSPRDANSSQQRRSAGTTYLCSEEGIAAPSINNVDTTSTVNGASLANDTVIVTTPTVHLQEHMEDTITLKVHNTNQSLSVTHFVDKLTYANVTRTLANNTRFLDSTDIMSPATNATYTNPGSMENMAMLEDVSIPSGFEVDTTLLSQPGDELSKTYQTNLEVTRDQGHDSSLGSDKASMKLTLNSTERLLDVTATMPSPAKHMQLLNLTKEFMDTPRPSNARNTSQLLYMTQISNSASTTPDYKPQFHAEGGTAAYQFTPVPVHMLSPMFLKGAQSDLALPTHTPDEDLLGEPMDVDVTLTMMGARTEDFLMQAQQQQAANMATSLQDVNNPNTRQKSRLSFGLDLTESTLDCSIELVDVSLSSTVLSQPHTNSMPGNNMSQSPSSQQLQQQLLKKQNSFEMDESLGILTPDQMKEFLDSTNTNTNNLELPLGLNVTNNNSSKLALHQMRIDQTPSPEELPLDPVEVKTDITDMILQQQTMFGAAQQRQNVQQQQQQQQQQLQTSSTSTEPVSLHTDTEPSKMDQMSKSSVSKISTSFITSVTSVTSLDTGYQGDGEMSRPASRGAGDHSPSNGPAARKGGHVSRQPSFNQQQHQQLPPIRRQDPMTDSDFFTESDADDIFHRGDRRAQVIDGQLYGPMLQPTASVFISEDPQMEDSCMESSGIFTDVENRCDEDLALMRRQDTQEPVTDMSPDAEGEDSTETVKSNRESGKATRACDNAADAPPTASLGQGQLSCSQTSSTMQSSCSTDRLSAATLSNRTSYCSVDGSAVHVDAKSFSSLEEAFVEHANTNTNPNTNTNTNRHANTNTNTTASASSSASAKRPKSCATGNDSWCEQQPRPLAVQKVSSQCKHASLTSLCNANGVYGAKSETGSPVFTGAQFATRSESSGAVGSKVSLSDSASVKSATGSGSRVSPKSPRLKSGTPGASTGVSNAPAAAVRKSHTPNKWDAVMNKIASNKALIKKNYSDVKSKVVTTRGMHVVGGGVDGDARKPSATATPSVRRSPLSSVNSAGAASPSLVKGLNSTKSLTIHQPTDTGSGGNGPQTPQNKRLLQGATKRGRSYSKDSQKSSQSDLSLTSGSPKLLAKTPLRAGKKRDVRNLSISPTDLGPPPKTNQTTNGKLTRPKPPPSVVTITQKRFNANVQNAAASPPPSSTATAAAAGAATAAASTPTGSGLHLNVGGKGSSPSLAKKQNFISKRLDSKKPTTKKDHNRVISGSQTSISTTPASTKNGSKAETPTDLLNEIGNGILHNNNNNNSSSNNNNNSGVLTHSRTSSQSSTPSLGGGVQHGKKITSNASAAPDKKSPTARKLQLQKQQQRSLEEAPPVTVTTAGFLDVAELQQLKLLNRHSCNGRLDYEALEKRLQHAEQQDKGVEALGVLLHYLVHDMDAFACPAAKRESATAKDSLNRTLLALDEAKHACTQLQEQLCDKEAYYIQREEELQALHRAELERAHANLSEFQMLAKDQITALEVELTAKDIEHRSTLECYRLEMDNKYAQKQQQLLEVEERMCALQERFRALDVSDQDLRKKLTSTEATFTACMQAGVDRERELNERLKLLTKELEELRSHKENNERELRDKLNLSQDEVAVLRSSRKSLSESLERVGSPRNSSNASEMTRLQSEAESLRCVLELKQKEISKLTKQNEELMRDAEERVVLQGKLSLLESKNEMLQSEFDIKADKEKEFLRQIDDIQKAFNHETVKRTRLSYDNEALQWQLKQRSEQLHIVEAKLQELSAHESHYTSTLSASSRSPQFNGSSLVSIHMEDVSPPASPLVKGVIEKTDSVSWVLEMDDETPEAAASKMVKRAGSFRSVERSPSARRHLSLSANAAGSSPYCAGPHALSQSMSATSVIRQHSSETVTEFAHRSHARIRSKSVSVKGSDSAPTVSLSAPKKSNKKLMRQNSAGNARKQELAPPIWKEPMSTSSPYNVLRPRTSTMKSTKEAEYTDEVLFCRSSSSSSRKLITCDTSALNSGERLEMRSLPTHPSVHDLKVLKKCQEIQESAGEAMVSGTNSEDEGCSASSDDIVCSTTTSASTSATTSSNLSLNQMKNSHMSLEEQLLLDKINSLTGTPMEVSWSDDTDAFESAPRV